LASSTRDLSPIQRAVIDGLAGSTCFYLTGGAALSAFYLHHRQSNDLDFFVVNNDELDELERRMEQLGAERGWSVEEVRRFPGFRRFIVRDGSDETIVDMVYEPVAQIVPLPDKPIHAGLRVDALEDLVANKLCALLGRGDVKDLIDLYFLDRAGVDVLSHIDGARTKDGGIEPLTLSFVLRGMSTDPSRLLLIIPVADDELSAFRDRLVQGLLMLAWPG